jgi:hypothetical protein
MKHLLTAVLAASLTLAWSTPAAQKSVYPYRWVRISSGLRSDQDVAKILSLVETASKHGLNGILLSAGLDRMDLQPPEFHQRLKKVKEFCDAKQVDIIPSFMSAGYGGAVLGRDKNLAAGLPVRDALFIAEKGEARLMPDPAPVLVNGGFEKHSEGIPDGFTAEGGAKGSVAVDTAEARGGKASLRFQNFDSDSEKAWSVAQDVLVHPYRCYRLSCWVKSENLKPSDPFGSGNFQLRVLGGQELRPLQYENPKFSPGQGWQRVAVGFNSWGYDRVRIVPSVSGGGDGKLWIDDLRVDEVALINVLRRPGTPLTVRGEQSGTLFEESRDYAAVSDPVMDFRFGHEGPAVKVLPGGRIREGERLRISFYHGTSIYNGQTPLCMSEPKLYEIWSTQARLVHEAIAPKHYLLNMDEVRTGGSCQACKSRGMTMGQILGDTLTRQFKLLRQVNPKAEIFVWSDMLDPNHNANPDRKWYYLSEGTFTDSWKHIPREMNIICWYYEKRVPSLAHFSRLGFRIMAGSYYDADDLENPKGWLEALDATPGACGILYTTWLNKYDLLGAFGDLISRR